MRLYRGSDPRLWTPSRYVKHDQQCDFCWNRIPRSKPGSTSGTRGTKAFYNAAFNIWECWPCRQEAARADEAREALDQGRRRAA